MTFHQWAATQCLDGRLRLAMEAIWKELAPDIEGNGLPPATVKRLLDDLMDGIKEQYDAEAY